jgi:hypothetical protein
MWGNKTIISFLHVTGFIASHVKKYALGSACSISYLINDFSWEIVGC